MNIKRIKNYSVAGTGAADFFCAEKLSDNDRTADVATESKRNENKGYFITVADSGKSVFAYKLACDKTVGKVVKLLKNHTPEQGEAKKE